MSLIRAETEEAAAATKKAAEEAVTTKKNMSGHAVATRKRAVAAGGFSFARTPACAGAAQRQRRTSHDELHPRAPLAQRHGHRRNSHAVTVDELKHRAQERARIRATPTASYLEYASFLVLTPIYDHDITMLGFYTET